MTPLVGRFIEEHKDKLGKRIIEVGSLNVNGSARDVVDIEVGIDIRQGKGVDLVCDVKDLKAHFDDGTFDSCVSTETLEHVEDWQSFITNTWDVVKDDGYLLMTMASRGKGRHAYPDDYWRFSLDQIREIYPSAEWVGDLGPVSIGWLVKKEGLFNLNVEPYKVP